jgi:HlyD family secretion protein
MRKKKIPGENSNMKNVFMSLKKIALNMKNFFLNHKKISLIVGGLLILAVIGFVVILSSRTGSNQVTYRSVKLIKGNITQTIDVVGNVRAVPSAVLNWQTSGVVGAVNYKVGDQVKAGDVLLSLLDESLSATILQAKTDLLTAQLDLDKAKVGDPNLDTAAQALADAQYDFTIKKVIRDYYITTGASEDKIENGRKAYDAANQTFLSAKQDYDAMNAKPKDDPQKIQMAEKLKTASNQRDAAIINLTRIIGNYWNYSLETVFNRYDTAKTTLAQAKITWEQYNSNNPAYLVAAEAKVQALVNTINSAKIISPFNGTITDLISSAGETVASGTEAMQIDDLTHLMINVSVSEVDVNKLAVGQDAMINFAAIPSKTYKGIVTQIGNAGSSASGVVQFGATIQVLDADEKVKPGFSTTISIVINNVQNVLLVPNLAVATDTSGKSFVLISKNGTMIPVAIELGSKSDQYTEVKSGNLNEGDTVLISISTTGSAAANNRAMFGILGGFGGGGGNDRPQTQPNRNIPNTNH